MHANSPGRRARPARDAGADGGRRAAARGDRRAGAARDRPRRPDRAAAATAPAGSTEIAEVVRVGRGDRRRARAAAVSGGPACRCPGRRGAGGLLAVAAREAVLASPAVGRLGAAGAGAAAAGRARGLLALDSGAPPARRPRHRRGDRRRLVRRRRRRWRCRWRSPARRLAAWAISSRRAGATAPRSSGRCPTSPSRSPTRSRAGRSLRASLPAAATSLDGPPAVELARLGAELDLGAPTADAIAAWRRRMRSPRVDAFAAALLSQRLAGGDLAGLLRRFADGRRRARPGRRGRQGGDRAGALHRPAGRRDADRRRPLRRADPARLPAQGARGARPRPCCSRSPPPCSSPASSRSAGSRGWSSEGAGACGRRAARLRGALAALAALVAAPAAPGRLSLAGRGRRCRRPASSPPTRCWSAGQRPPPAPPRRRPARRPRPARGRRRGRPQPGRRLCRARRAAARARWPRSCG